METDMRVIPKRTKVQMEFFKGIGVIDILVIMAGAALAGALLLSDLPYHVTASVVAVIILAVLVVPVDDEKGYMMIYAGLRFFARYRDFGDDTETAAQEVLTEEKASEEGQPEKKKKKQKAATQSKAVLNPSVRAITPFTGVDGGFIEYGKSYCGAVMEIPSIEFRFLSEERQNGLIDHVFAGVLRELARGETASLIKLDRPVIYDEFLRTEQQKKADIKEAYLNGLLNEDELTKRVGIIEDRMEMLRKFNNREMVYIPFYYLAFYGRDKEALNAHIGSAVAQFGTRDMACRRLEGPELAIFLKYNYTVLFDEREAYRLKPEEYLDWILPKRIAFTARTVKYDDLITHNLKVTRYPTSVANAWGCQLFNMPDTRVVMKMKPMDRTKSVRQIDRSIEELRSQGENTGRASKQIELSEHVQTLGEVLRLLQGDNEVLFNVDTYITAYDYEYSQEMLEYTGAKGEKRPTTNFKKRIRSKLSEEGFRSSDMMMQQFEVYAAANVSANDCLEGMGQAIHSSSVAAVFPFVYKHLMDKGGVYIGDSGGVPAFINFFQRDKERVNSNMVIIGKSGSGKSYATKTMLTHLAAENSKIFILDPENEYLKMAEKFDGKIIDVGSASQGRLNPFHVITNLTDEEGAESETEAAANSLNMHLQFLEEFYKQILQGIETDALELLNNVTIRMYEEKGIDQSTDLSKLGPEDYPTFDDLYEKLLNDFQLATGEYSKKNLRILLNFISKFAEGGRNSSLWNGAASISTNENFIVFNFQSLLANKNNTIANAQMLLVLKWLDNEIIKNRDYNIKYGASRRIIIVIDEAHVFIDSKYPIALDFMFQLAKRIRKYNGMQIVITQNIKDFVGTEELARKSTAIINASQYSFIFPLAPNDMHDLCKLYEKAGAINESEQEDIVNNGRGRAFVITSPSERCCVDIIAGEAIERLFTE